VVCVVLYFAQPLNKTQCREVFVCYRHKRSESNILISLKLLRVCSTCVVRTEEEVYLPPKNMFRVAAPPLYYLLSVIKMYNLMSRQLYFNMVLRKRAIRVVSLLVLSLKSNVH